MPKEIKLGGNPTGLKASLDDARALLESLKLQLESPQATADMENFRRHYREEGNAVGPVPSPINLRSASGAAGATLKNQQLPILLDKLSARAALERTRVRPNGAALTRLDDASLPQVLETLRAAELIDSTSWEMLSELASGMKQTELTDRKCVVLTAEHRHLEKVRNWLSLAMAQSAHLSGTE